MSLQLGEGTCLKLSEYPDRAPILTVNVHGLDFSLTLRGDIVDASGLALVHEFGDVVGRFVAECERVHVEQADTEVPGSERAA